MRLAIVTLIGLWLGAAPAFAQNGSPPRPIDQKSNLTIVDVRPDEDKVRDSGSVWMTSCSFGVAQFGDDATVPTKMVLLRRDVEEALGTPLPNVTLTIKRYRIIFNQAQLAIRNSTGNRNGDRPLSELIGRVWVPGKCPEFDYKPEEVSTQYSPLIVQILAEIGGRDYEVRVVYSTDKEYPGFLEPAAFAVLRAAMHKAHMELADEIKMALAPPAEHLVPPASQRPN